jgi:hypothetical protein
LNFEQTRRAEEEKGRTGEQWDDLKLNNKLIASVCKKRRNLVLSKTSKAREEEQVNEAGGSGQTGHANGTTGIGHVTAKRRGREWTRRNTYETEREDDVSTVGGLGSENRKWLPYKRGELGGGSEARKAAAANDTSNQRDRGHEGTTRKMRRAGPARRVGR